MNSFSSMEKLYNLADLIFTFFTLSFCWIVGTLLGGIVFGWAPSTSSVLAVLRDHIMSREKFAFRSFFSNYKSYFVESNKIGLIISTLSVIIYINRQNFILHDEIIFNILTGLSTFSAFILAGLTLYIFPLLVHYEVKVKKAFIQSFAFMIFRPHYTIILGLWTWIIFSISFMIPGLALFFGISLFSYGWMAITYQLFRRNEEYLKEQQKTA